MASTIQRKLEFKVRKSSRLSGKPVEAKVTSDLERSEKRCPRRKNKNQFNLPTSPRKRSGSESEPNSPLKLPPTCSPSKKKKEVPPPSLSRETPSKSCLMDKFPCSTLPLSPRKENNNIDQITKIKQTLSSPVKDLIYCEKRVTPKKKRNLLLNSPIKENLCIIPHENSPTKRRLVLGSPARENCRVLSPRKCDNSPIKGRRLVLGSPVKDHKSQVSHSSTPVVASPSIKSNRYSSYNQVKQSLHTAKPERLVGREKEVGEINQFLEKNLANQSAGSLYISGAPGTGKTAALLHIIDDVKADYKCKICYLNCMMVKDSSSVFRKLYQDITGKALTGKRDPSRSMEKCLTTSKTSVILVLDEIDQLDSKSQEVLYTIFEWPTLPHSKLILVGIANALDLTDRILPRLQAQPKCRPQLLNFAPYSREQITAVIQDRLKKLEKDGVCVMEASAIQFCARKVSAVAGDMRKALDVCRRAVELVEAEIRGQQIKTSVCSSPKKGGHTDTLKKIGVMQISRVISEVYGTGVKTSSTKEETVPLQQKLVTCSLLLMLKSGKSKEVNLGKLHETYGKLCKKRQMAPVDQSEFFSLCTLLEARGIMGLKKAKESRLAKISLKLDEKEIEHALQDKVLITTILQEGLQ
ncbi:hypothetical protein SNE40_023208 [Patella caerulea]|uniref:Cell division control protein n=1 Tax=Patella caerulea TaxID=87958 RepID=A0AAN8J070_PATCE